MEEFKGEAGDENSLAGAAITIAVGWTVFLIFLSFGIYLTTFLER